MAETGSTTVRVSRDVHRRLKTLAEEEGKTLSEAIDRLLEDRRRAQFFHRTNVGFARLRDDREDWGEYEWEADELEGASDDGLNEFPYDG